MKEKRLSPQRDQAVAVEFNLSAPHFGNRHSHAGCLERLTLEALSRGDAVAAFRYIDRRCRLKAPPTAHHFILRAEVLQQRSQWEAALASLRQALKIAPDDLQVNRRMLDWSKDQERICAARILCKRDDQPAVLIEAAKVLGRSGLKAVGSIRVFDTYIRGWAVWSNALKPELCLVGDGYEERRTLEADPHFFLRKSGFANGTHFEWKRNSSHELHGVVLRSGNDVILSERISTRASMPRSPFDGLVSKQVNASATRNSKQPLTIIVPVYRDFEATRACLKSLQREMQHLPEARLILVNDASPESEMRPLLEAYAKRLKATLLTNRHNMGFVGSVNRALAMVKGGDVVLLNADTLLPGDALSRLAKTARGDRALGTITPLSNNGEFTSFPLALHANPMPTSKELASLDGVAARVNKNRLIDIPSGIGFCLYIKAACLKAIGGLSEGFQGGYLEDVDFSLRARAGGFRNVCDASVFVAHAGSKSFLSDKHSLVSRNLPIVSERFPQDQEETKAFVELDPLRSARAHIEREVCAGAAFDILIVTSTGRIDPVIRARAGRLLKRGSRVWFAVVANDIIRFVNATEAMPQSLTFRLDSKREKKDFAVYFESLKFKRIELADPPSVFIMDMLRSKAKPIDLFIADAEWLKAKTIVDEVQRLIAPCKEARAFSEHYSPARKTAIIVEEQESLPMLPRYLARMRKRSDQSPICGLIGFGPSRDDFLFMRELASQTRLQTKKSSFVVLGGTFDDLSLMLTGNMYVTGPIDADELAVLCRLYEIDKLFAGTQRPLFGHPLTSAAKATGLPFGSVDRSFGAVQSQQRDLAIGSKLETQTLAGQLAAWMAWA